MKNRFNPASSRNALILLALFSAFAASAETPVAKTAPLATATGSPAPQGIRALLIAPTETVLSSQMDGRSLSIPVKDGDTAKKGATCCRKPTRQVGGGWWCR